MTLEEQKNKLEESIKRLKVMQDKRIRAEADYAAELRNLTKLGFNDLPEAVKAYQEFTTEFNKTMEEINTEFAEFEGEFDAVFGK